MRTLLVITAQTTFQATIEAAIDVAAYRLICKEDPVSAGGLLTRGAIDAIVLDVPSEGPLAIRLIEEIKALAPGVPVIAYSEPGDRSWQEEAYLLGVAHILEKPVRARLLQNLLDREFAALAGQLPAVIQDTPPLHGPLMPVHGVRGLEPLRRFSSLLVHSLDAGLMLENALQQLREVLGINRAAVFLRKPSALTTDGAPSSDDRWLRPAHTIGHEPGIIQDFPLSLATGIGRYLYTQARILRADAPEARASREISKEFSTLGGAIALPIHDRQMLLGVLIIDERITGGGFGDEELIQLFHWLEELGIALRNSWRHEQLTATHGLIDDILAGLGSGCVVVGANCGVLHANPTAMHYLAPGGKKAMLDFADIPQRLGSLIFLVIQKGESVPAFKWQPPHYPGVTCRVSIRPFSVGRQERINAALVVIDDITEHERAVALEMEAGKLRLVRQMAWHLAHEIGNAVTPISTMQQLLELQGDDAAVRAEMSGILRDSVRRITRLTQQMNFLSREWDGKSGELLGLGDIIQSAYADANQYFTGKQKPGLIIDASKLPWKVEGDPKALRHAFSELILNGMLANVDNPTVTVRASEDRGDGVPRIAVDLHDTGPGFPPEVADKIGEPFQSTRSVGLGLGLAVSRKIIESHSGQIEVQKDGTRGGHVRVTLPLPKQNNN